MLVANTDDDRFGHGAGEGWRFRSPSGRVSSGDDKRRILRIIVSRRLLGEVFGAADQESGRRRCAARMNARGNSQSRALAIHPPVRTALTPAVGSDFAKVLSKLPPEELERCSELLYNQRARPVPRQQRAATLGSTFASSRSREHGLPHQGHGLHPSLSHRWTAAQFLGALARVASGEPRSASPIPAG